MFYVKNVSADGIYSVYESECDNLYREMTLDELQKFANKDDIFVAGVSKKRVIPYNCIEDYCRFVQARAKLLYSELEIGFWGSTPLLSVIRASKDRKTSIPEGVSNISSYAYQCCILDENLEIPKSVEKIELCAFNDTNIVSVKVPDSVEILGNYAFSDCKKLETVHLGKHTDTIGRHCFAHSGLKSVEIPLSVTSIEASCFEGCASLETITLSENLTHLGNACFAECASLKSIKIPEGVQELENNMFYGCESLESVEFSEGLEVINFECFSGCSSLTSIVFPETLRVIDWGVFNDCVSLREVYLPKSLKEISPNFQLGKKGDITFKVHRSSYASSFCESSYVNFEYLD